MGRLIGRKLQEMPNLDFVYYIGDMTLVDRDRAIETLHLKKDVKVMVGSRLHMCVVRRR